MNPESKMSSLKDKITLKAKEDAVKDSKKVRGVSRASSKKVKKEKYGKKKK